jgi:hypothetical protein
MTLQYISYVKMFFLTNIMATLHFEYLTTKLGGFPLTSSAMEKCFTEIVVKPISY